MKTYVSVSENHSFQDDNLSKFSKVLLRSLAELFGVFIQVRKLVVFVSKFSPFSSRPFR